jgi:Kelch motif/Galactose oxidase, central domain
MRVVACLVFGLILCAVGARAQWTNLGSPPTGNSIVNPNCALTSFPCYTPSNATPQITAWTTAVYDPLDKGIILYAMGPSCCYDVSNALFFMNTLNAVAEGTVDVSDGSVWRLKWSNNDDVENGTAPQPISSIIRSNNVVTVTLPSPGTRARVGEYVVVWGVSDPSFDGTFQVASTSSLPPELQFTYNQAGPSTARITNSGIAGGPAEALHQPTDREPYAQFAWDTKRNYMWVFSGDAMGSSPGVYTPYCSECPADDMYLFNFTQPNAVATQVCGNFTVSCAPRGVDEGAVAYDPTTDVIVLFGGLIDGSQVNDTWEYKISTSTWTHTCSSNSNSCVGGGSPPEARNREALVYDASAGAIITFGGTLGSTIFNDTWAYSTVTHQWTRLLTSVAPTGTEFPVMDYDPDRQSVIYVTPDTPSQVWELTNVSLQTGTATWSNLDITGGPTLASPSNCPNGPGCYAINHGAYDQTAKRFVLFTKSDDAPYSVWALQIGGSTAATPGASLNVSMLSVPGCAYCVTLTNNGGASLIISSISITGTNASDFKQANNCGSSLTVGATCSISIAYNPSVGGTETATLTITDNAPGSPQAVMLTGTGSVQ